MKQSDCLADDVAAVAPFGALDDAGMAAAAAVVAAAFHLLLHVGDVEFGY